MKTCVIIPTYNEAQAIQELIKDIRAQNFEVIVIDDGSKDNTSELAKSYGAVVLKNYKNEGKGASLIKGFNYALDNNFDAVITMDGDGQHLPSDIPYFVRLAEYSDRGILIGNRMQKIRCMPIVRFLTNKLMSWMISKIAKQNIPDTQCGFRLIRSEVLKKAKLTTSKYETESELLIKAAHLRYKIESVPIKTVYQGGKSRINPLFDTLRFFKLIIRELWITLS